jgi:hypothetical protein
MSAKGSTLQATVLLACAILAAAGALSATAAHQGHFPPPAFEDVTCRILESHAAEWEGVTLLVFHHSQSGGSARLSALLRQHAGERVEFQAEGHAWRPATVLRLSSCFGRGLLVMAGQDATLTKGNTFTLRFHMQSKPH